MTTTEPRLFELIRTEDETGVSGTGSVAWGVEFPDGKCVLRWRTEFSSVTVYDSMTALEAIHGHGGKTVVRFLKET